MSAIHGAPDQLEYTHTGAYLASAVLWAQVEPFQHVKGFGCIQKLAHLHVWVVGGFGGSLLQQDSTAGAIGINKLHCVILILGIARMFRAR